MWKYFSDLLWLNEEAMKLGGRPKANPLGFFIVTTWIIMSWSQIVSLVSTDKPDSEIIKLKSEMASVSEKVRLREFDNSVKVTELDKALEDEYESAFNSQLVQNQKLSKQLQRLRDEIKTKNADWKKCRHPAALDSHRE